MARWLFSVTLSGIAAVLLGIVVDRLPGLHTFFVEDGPIETAQAILLFAIASLFVVVFARSAGSRALFCLLVAYGCIFAVTREIPRCGSAFVGGDLCLSTSWKRTIVLAATALGVLALVVKPLDWRAAFRLSNLRWTWPIAFVAGFLVAAEMLESFIYYSEIEEFLELVAYLHLGAMAIAILRQPAPAWRSQTAEEAG